MGRHKDFNSKKYVLFEEETDTSVCLVCEKKLKGHRTANIKRHYKLMHNKHFDESDSDTEIQQLSSIVKKKSKHRQVYLKMDKNKFLKCCAGLVTVKNIPFRIFDDMDYFKELISPYEEEFKVNLNSKNISLIVTQAATKMKEVIRKNVNKRMISLKVDIATRMEKHILGINIQYIKDYKICINTLGMLQIKKKHTGEFLKTEIINCLREYNLDINQVYSSTTDNGANVVKASKMLKELQEEMQVRKYIISKYNIKNIQYFCFRDLAKTILRNLHRMEVKTNLTFIISLPQF